MGLPKLRLAALVLLLAALQLAAAARTEQQQQSVAMRSEEGLQGSGKTLNTYFFDATKPEIKLSSAVSPRPQRTALTIKLPSSSSVGSFMPVVTPRASGMTHSVSNTWQALKNLASMFASLKPINSQAGPNTPQLFPRAAMAVSAASDNAPTRLDIASAIALAEASGRHNSWVEVTPSSVLLLPYGGSVAAVADLMDVTYDVQSDSVTLQVDVVHHPDTVSEFTPHAPQTLAVDAAHYHFDTAPGVRVDAQALLDSLAGAGNPGMAGVHFFIKGREPSPTPLFKCLVPQLSLDRTQVPVNSEGVVTVRVEKTYFNNACLCNEFGDQVESTRCCDPDKQGVCTAEFGCNNDDGWCCAGDCDCPSSDTERVACEEPSRKKSGAGATKGSKALPGPAGTNSSRGGQDRFHFYDEFPLDLPIGLTISGGGQWVQPASLPPSRHNKEGSTRQVDNNLTSQNSLVILLDEFGLGTARFRATGTDPIIINVSSAGEQPLLVAPAALSVNRVYAPATKLRLVPSKAYRRCHDPVTLSALATDAAGAPVAGAKVAFSAFGDCNTDTDQTVKTTGANGIATITLNSHVPGVESVVAAGVDATSAPVMSNAAHVHFYVERHHAEDREREYYDNGDDERYAQAAAQAAQELVQQVA